MDAGRASEAYSNLAEGSFGSRFEFLMCVEECLCWARRISWTSLSSLRAIRAVAKAVATAIAVNEAPYCKVATDMSWEDRDTTTLLRH